MLGLSIKNLGTMLREIRSAERAFAVHQITSNPNNSSQLWKTIRSFIPKKSASMRSFSKDDRTVANDFNRFFSSVGQVAVDRINSLANECNFDLSAPAFDPRIFPVTDQFNFMHVDWDEVAQARFIRRISAVSNAIDTIDNEMICFISFCLNCIRHGRNATYEPGLRLSGQCQPVSPPGSITFQCV